MKMCLASFATGEAARFVPHTRPPMSRYAAVHGYETCFDAVPEIDPPSWGKVPLLRDLLGTFDAVLWLDADVLILDRSDDIAAGVEDWAVTAMVRHQVESRHTHGIVQADHDGLAMVPNSGVWFVRREALPLLDALLARYPQHRDSIWWEQTALIEMLPAGWSPQTHWLDPGWNRHPFDKQPTSRVRFVHCTAIPDRVKLAADLSEFAG
jgi:hypothetical protein